MNDTEKLIEIWKTNKLTLPGEPIINSTKIKPKVMDIIVKFENREKLDRKLQIAAAIVLAIWTVSIIYDVDLQASHFIGLILLIIGAAFAILATNTDNFPDTRQFDTLKYLQCFKEAILKRTRMHVRYNFLSLFFFMPGCYLTFKDSFEEFGIVLIPISIIITLFISYFWYEDYSLRSKDVLKHVTELLAEFEQN